MIGWFKWCIYKVRKPKEPEFIKFLSKLESVEKYISIFTIAEVIEVLKTHPDFRGYKIDEKYFEDILEILKRTASISIIEETGIIVKGKKQYKKFYITPNIVNFTYTCGELKDSIHVDIAKSNDLWFVTHDDKVGRLKVLYKKIIGSSKFIRRLKKIAEK